jgi:hypothetical protein
MNMAVRVRRSSQPQAVSVRTTPNAFTIAVRYRPRHACRSSSPHLPSPIDTAQAMTSHWEGDQGRWEHKRGAGR